MDSSSMEVSLIHYCGSDLSVANAARVSFHKESNWDVSETLNPPTGETVESAREKNMPIRRIHSKNLRKEDIKLIRYLARNKHFSPFNHCFITMRIKAPLFCARQLVKHKFMPWNEVSRRYVDEPPEFFIPDEWRKRAENVKQGSSDETITDLRVLGFTSQTVDSAVDKFVEHAIDLYNDMLTAGVCPEQARMILPQNMMTEWWWSGTLGAYADMLNLRLDPHTQQETREIAEAIHTVVQSIFPVSAEALLENA